MAPIEPARRPWIFRADRLGGVFHQRDAARPGDLGQGHGVDGLAEQVYGDDGLRGRSDQRRHVLRIDIERLRIDVGKNRPGAKPRDRAGRGEERETRQDHLVAGGNVQGHQGQQQGVAARGAADGVFRLAVDGQLLFELRDLRPEHESAAIADPAECGEDFCLQSRVLASQVQERNALDRALGTSLSVIGGTHRGCPEE